MTGQLLDREEYVEQAYFFRTYRERLADNAPAQELLIDLQEEILATTKLPMALDFLAGEIKHKGRLSDGMFHLPHYFSPFQAHVMSIAESDTSKFDMKIALLILEKLAEYLSREATPAGLFVYQFECLCRNRLGYDQGLLTVANDPFYNDDWRTWILRLRQAIGSIEFCELIYARSEEAVIERRRRLGDPTWQPTTPVLFGRQEGRIAKANRGKDPLYMFAALQRQLDYPTVPRQPKFSDSPVIHPVLQERLKQLEQRLKILEMEQQGKLDLSEFYANPPSFEDPLDPPVDLSNSESA